MSQSEKETKRISTSTPARWSIQVSKKKDGASTDPSHTKMVQQKKKEKPF